MTGQVKEELLTRAGELGVRISQGTIEFAPAFLRPGEFTAAPGVFHYVDPQGREVAAPLPARALAFTFCGVPVVYHRGPGAARLQVQRSDQGRQEFAGRRLDAATSALVFARSGRIERIDVQLGAGRPQPRAGRRPRQRRPAAVATA
jgi:hypothetical protein